VTLVAVALLVGTGVSLLQAMRANEEAKNAAANLRLAIAAVDEMYTEVAETSLRTTPRSQEFRRKILEKALKFYLRFAEENSDPNLDYETAMAWRRVGEVYHRFEQNDKSQEALLTAIDSLQALVAQSPDQPRYRRDLADTYRFLSKPLEVTGQFQQGKMYCRMAIEIQAQLVEEFSDESEYRAALAVTYHQLGHMLQHSDESMGAFTVSSKLFKELLEETPQNPVYVQQLAHDYAHFGKLLYDVGKVEEAQETYRASVELIGEPKGPSDAGFIDSYQSILGGTYRSWGVLLRNTERPKEAETAHRNAVRLFGELVQDFPSVIYFHSQMGLSQIELGRTLAAVGQEAEAKEAFEAAYRIFAELEKSFPDNSTYERGRENAHNLIHKEAAQLLGIPAVAPIPEKTENNKSAAGGLGVLAPGL
jgi:tetratricopeptide (TPR) repeat protein